MSLSVYSGVVMNLSISILGGGDESISTLGGDDESISILGGGD